MPSDSNGNYSLPDGYRAVTGEIIQASQHNPPLEDMAQGLTERLMRSGVAPMAGPLKLAPGSNSAPSLSWSDATSTGIVDTDDGWAVVINGVIVAEFGAAGLISGVGTAAFGDNSVTYQKLQKPTGTQKLLGTPSVGALAISGAANNGSGLIRLTVSSTANLATGNVKIVQGVGGTEEANGSWTITVIDATRVDLQGSTFTNAYTSGGFLGGSVEEITMGPGVHIEKNQLRTGFAPPAAFKNLAIKVATNTTATVTADFIAVTDGTKYQTLAFSGTINLGTTGANALDAGTIAAATWYAVWAIAKADGTTALLASTSLTSPTMPTDYTYKARVGMLRTAAGSAQLMGTWQLGRRAQYVLGLAQTTAIPAMITGISGNAGTPTWTAVSVSNFVPPTASRISLYLNSQTDSSGSMAAPNNSYGNITATTVNPPPLRSYVSAGGTILHSLMGEFLLESSNVYYASVTAASSLIAMGWEDNI